MEKQRTVGEATGRRISEVRQAIGMTQAELARRMTAALEREIRPLIVTRIEGGKRPLTVDELVVIAHTLDIRPADLLDPADAPIPAVSVQAARMEFQTIRDQLLSADAHRTALIDRWFEARQRLRDELDKIDADASEKFLAGSDDRLGDLFGAPDIARWPAEFPGDWTS